MATFGGSVLRGRPVSGCGRFPGNTTSHRRLHRSGSGNSAAPSAGRYPFRRSRNQRRCTFAGRHRTPAMLVPLAWCRRSDTDRIVRGRGKISGFSCRSAMRTNTVRSCGIRHPPRSKFGALTRRPIESMTVRARSTSKIVARRRSLPPSSTSRDQFGQHVWVAPQPLERPAQSCSRGFVARTNEGQQFVTDSQPRHLGVVVATAA